MTDEKDTPEMSRALEPRKAMISLLQSDKVKKAFATVVNEKFMTVERMLTLCMHAARKTPKLLDCEPQSVLGAMMTAAALNLEPNTTRGLCYLIPYNNSVYDRATRKKISKLECQFQIGYAGYEEMAWRNRDLVELQAEPLFSKDLFEREIGSNTHFRFVAARGDRGDLEGAFCFTKLNRGDGRTGEMSTFMARKDIERIRNSSQNFRYLLQRLEYAKKGDDASKVKWAQRSFDQQPWILWEDRMFRKTAIRRHLKEFPISDALSVAAGIDEASDQGRVKLDAMADPDFARDVIESGDLSSVIEGETVDEDGVVTQTDDGSVPDMDEATPEQQEPKPKGKRAAKAKAPEPQAQSEADPRQDGSIADVPAPKSAGKKAGKAGDMFDNRS